MRFLLTTIILLSLALQGRAQSLYYPTATTWDTVSTDRFGWCPDSLAALQSYLDDKNTKGFIILKDGKLAVEWYYDDFTQDSNWYWASAGKTMMATLIGIAQQEGYLDINDPTSDYLGAGWTDCTPAQEADITIRHQLAMTTGLDYNVDFECTDDTCLQYLNPPGTEWYYHNAPYTLLMDVLEQATGRNPSLYFRQKIGDLIGANGLYVPYSTYGRTFYSKPRDMARFGLLILSKGVWNGNSILSDTAYYNQMVSTSQSINEAYGYLWWVNGKSTYRLPGTTLTGSGHLVPTAPADMFAGLGRDDQKVYVVPSQNMVVVRMGEAADSLNFALSGFDAELWGKLSNLGSCLADSTSTGLAEVSSSIDISLYPNPAEDRIVLNWQPKATVNYHMQLFGLSGEVAYAMPLFKTREVVIPLSKLSSGMYIMLINGTDGSSVARRVMVR